MENLNKQNDNAIAMAKVKFKSKEDKQALWHATSHVLADAVKQLWPNVKLGIGPAIEEGFYYDFDRKQGFSPEDIQKIEKKMREIIKADPSFKRVYKSRSEAKKLLKNEPYKLELLKEIPDKKISFYQHGKFIDLCAGPLIKSVGQIGAFKLLNVAGAYWRGDVKRPMLQRIYGISFPSKAQLDVFLKQKEEAEKRDHRKLGKQLGLFSIHPEDVGPGLVHWHPKGAIIRGIIEDFWKAEHVKQGYKYVYTPHIGNLDLWKKSGHWKFYREYMYSPMKVDTVTYLIKPMNCPFHIQIYKSKIRSYRDLPIRYCEMGTVYRYEIAGALHGLTRVRGFTQDDSHIFCRPDQLLDEVSKVLDLALLMLKGFGFKEYKIELSIRDPKQKEKYLGSDKVWKNAESALSKALENKKLKYKRAEGEAVFYGPKIDIKLIDALGREWQGTTIQVDFNFPEKFDLNYIGKDNKEHRIVMVHRTILGSMERFFGCLIEHYGGAFPLWLAPVQVKVISFTDRNKKYAQNVAKQLADAELRVELDERPESVQYKVREAEVQKIPYILVAGDKEEKAKTIAVRKRGVKGIKFGVKVPAFIKQLQKEIEAKK